MPRERAPVQQPCCPSQERLLRLQRLGLASFIQQSDARDSAEERAGVKLHRSLAKALPVDHARTVAEINDVSGVERAMHKARDAFLGLRARQTFGQRHGRGSQRRIRGDERRDPCAHPIHYVRSAQWRSQFHRQRCRALQPACGQLASAPALPAPDEVPRGGSLQPADDQHPQITFPGQQRRHADVRYAPQPGCSERLVQCSLRRRILRVCLDCDPAAPGTSLKSGARARRVAAQQELDATVAWPRYSNSASQARRAYRR